MQHKHCSNCSVDMTCGSMEGACWCMAYEPMSNIVEGKDCLCEACLKATLQKATTPSIHIEKKEQEADYYIENGLYVFTSSYHLKRGFCCKNGCRHCPYGYKKH